MAASSKSSDEPTRFVLDGVPRIHFYEGGDACPEDDCYPSCLRAWMEFMGDGYGCKLAPAPAGDWRPECGYAYFMGTSGAAFRLVWAPEAWETGNGDLMRIAPDPMAPYQRALWSAGYAGEMLLKPDLAASLGVTQSAEATETDFRDRIVASLRSGRPAIGFGVVGPPEPCLIAGYDEDGDVLIGWSFFQCRPESRDGTEFEPSGYFRKRDWFADTSALLTIGEKGERAPMVEVCRATLRWAVEVMLTPEVRGRRTGIAAYQAWAEALQREEDFRTEDEAILRSRYEAHDMSVGLVAEARWYGSLFLRQMASVAPSVADDLEVAAECFVDQHDLMWAVWEFARHGEPAEHPGRFATSWTRERILPMLKIARQKDELAVAHLEQAVAKL